MQPNEGCILGLPVCRSFPSVQSMNSNPCIGDHKNMREPKLLTLFSIIEYTKI